MGRWGHTLFACDQDLDIKSDIEHDVQKLSGKKEVDFTSGTKTIETRELLDSGIGKTLFDKYIADKDEFYGDYKIVIFAALLMSVGATIDTKKKDYLRAAIPKIQSRSGYAGPLFDRGFRDPGKVAFEAMLENYTNGEPRTLSPTCWDCGKNSDDLGEGKQLLHCARCKDAAYCDKDCQKRDWSKHKKLCPWPRPLKPGQPEPAFHLMNC